MRRHAEITQDQETCHAVADPAVTPSDWTPEHVGARMIEGFETLLALSGRVGPKGHGSSWPAMLQEFADLVDEEAMKHARDAFVRDRRRPSAEQISRMDEALAWPMQYGEGVPLLCDAAQLWAFCRAGSFSIAAVLRRRNAWARLLAGNMTIAGNNLRQVELRDETGRILAWAERMKEERRLDERDAVGYAEGAVILKAAAMSRHAEVTARLHPVTVLPHDAVPNKVLSRTSLDRHLARALRHFADKLRDASVEIR